MTASGAHLGAALALAAEDFTSDSAAYVDPIVELIDEMGMLSRDHVLIQTFWPADLDRAAERIAELVPDAQRRPFLQLLTLQGFSEAAISVAAARGYDGLRGRVRVRVPGRDIRAFRIAPRRMQLASGAWERFRVRIPRRARRAARGALRAGGTAHARIRMRAVDRFGDLHRVRVRRIAIRR